MRYAIALAVALLIGVSAKIPGAFAAEKDTPLAAGSTMSAQYYGTADPGTVAGPMTPSVNWPVVEHDSGRN